MRNVNWATIWKEVVKWKTKEGCATRSHLHECPEFEIWSWRNIQYKITCIPQREREREWEIEFTSLRTRRKVAWADNLHTTPYAQLTEGPGKQSLRSIYGCIRWSSFMLIWTKSVSMAAENNWQLRTFQTGRKKKKRNTSLSI